MHHYQTNYSILEHAILLVYVYFVSTLFIRTSLGVGVETI